MAELLRRALAHERKIDEETRTIDFVASTTDKDRHGTILVQDWDLRNFNRNPVFLWAHQSRMPPIGRVDKWETGEQQSKAQVRFAKTEVAEEIFNLYRDGFLNAVSVGFDYGEYDFVKDAMILRKNELYELSGVSLPSNAQALAEGRSAGRVDGLSRMLRHFMEPELGRAVEDQDIDLMLAGAAPEHIERLRCLDELEARVAELEKLLAQKPNVNPDPEEIQIYL